MLLAASADPPADVIVIASRIYTVDSATPMVEAIAIRDGRIVVVGSRAEVLAHRGAGTRILDYTGRTIIPGIIDAHAHLLSLGKHLQNVDLIGAQSYDEVISRVRERARHAPVGAWILGRGWDQNRWLDKQFPTHDALSRALPDHPVKLDRVDGHAVLANAFAMELAGVSVSTPDPSGGKIVRKDDGRTPSGVFLDNAGALIEHVVPAETRAVTRDRIIDAMREANRWGLTGVHDAGSSPSVIDLFEELADSESLTLRIYAMLNDDWSGLESAFARGPRSGLAGGYLWARSVKLYADGTLGSRGAALLEPYADDPGNSGLVLTSERTIYDVATQALRSGFQVAAHAIGDRGNRMVLDAFERALSEGRSGDHRFRVEHAQVVSPVDIPRFAKLGIIPSMQAVHATSDMPWAEARVGAERIRGAYAWRSLLETGVVIPNGSDFPVEAVNPLLSFHAAVTRQDGNNSPAGGWYPEQRMTREEALASMTLWPAYAGFQDDVLGTLSPGKFADFVAFDQDIMAVAMDQILATGVAATVVGGRVVYESD